MTEQQRIAIIHHIEYCREAAIIARDKFRGIRPVAGSNYVGNQYVYWKNVASGMSWAIQLARQIVVDTNGENCTPIQHVRSDTGSGR